MEQYDYDNDLPIGLIIFIVGLALAVAAFLIAAMWKIFTKAGQPGWAAIIPIYNIYNDKDRWQTRLLDLALSYSARELHFCDLVV